MCFCPQVPKTTRSLQAKRAPRIRPRRGRNSSVTKILTFSDIVTNMETFSALAKNVATFSAQITNIETFLAQV